MTDGRPDSRLSEQPPAALSPDRWARVADLFDRAADLGPSARAPFLDAHAVGADGAPDGALREEVERLLAADPPRAFLGGRLAAPPSERPPPTAGPWRLTARIGRGGMGEVWCAERATGGFEQSAAVKLVRPGVGDAMVGRFCAERRILAGLDHPAIARLLGGGTASDGRPYLAAELVDGQPVTAYADACRLGVNARLALFAEVCEAVAYAHARLVVHRDLKPSNVMVTTGDDAGRVKLLDFGIAKLLDDDGGPRTQTGRPLLTPAYAAPEQVEGGAVTTATDVYSLGVLLYELLTGARPASNGDVTRPSDAVATADRTAGRLPPSPAAGAPGTGALRPATADRLRRRLRGDLDRIVLKALRADPERRYRGAAELGADVQRHLDGMPVEARPESVTYRVGKFVRRHRALVAAASLALVSVVGGAAVSVVQSQRVLHEQRVNAAVSDYMLGLFRSTANPSAADSALTVAEVTARGARRARTELADQPEAQAEVYRLIGEVYLSVGRLDAADEITGRSVALWESVGAGRSSAAARSRTVRGLALSQLGRYTEAEAAIQRALDDLAVEGTPERDQVAETRAVLARVVESRARAAEPLPELRLVTR